MLENEWWSRHIKPRWHNLARGRVARKVQDVTNKGAPDVDACWNGYQCKVELKYSFTVPHRDDTKLTFSRYSKDEPNKRTILSREQVRNLEEWDKAGGNAFVLIGVNKSWYLLRAHVAILNNDGMTMQHLKEAAVIWGESIETITSVPEMFECH